MTDPSKDRYLAFLERHYGVKFPDSFFSLCDFLIELPLNERGDFLNAVNLDPVGPVALVLELDRGMTFPTATDPASNWAANQYYRDLPEFLTCFTGICDGYHIGLLCDVPQQGIRGAASFYNGDGDCIYVYESLIDAIAIELDRIMESMQEEIEAETEEDEPSDLDKIHQAQAKLRQFITTRNISVTDGRPDGLTSDTGLSLIVPELLEDEASQRAIASLQEGRSLWYWDHGDPSIEGIEAERTVQAYHSLKQAYTLLNRPEVITVLDVYYLERLQMLSYRRKNC